MQVKIKYLHPNAKTPTYATDGSACFDLYAADVTDYLLPFDEGDYTDIEFDTGLAFEVPDGHVMMVFSRSGHGFKHGATLCNSVGIIDSDYRGSVKVRYNTPIPAVVGDRIAQALILPIQQVHFHVTDTLSDTNRGTQGFGSTGA